MAYFPRRRKCIFYLVNLLLVYFVVFLIISRQKLSNCPKEIFVHKRDGQIVVKDHFHERCAADKCNQHDHYGVTFSTELLQGITRVSKVIRNHLPFYPQIHDSPNYYDEIYQQLLTNKMLNYSYSNFSLIEPNFANNEDREWFFKHPVYVSDMKNGRTPQQLRGTVAVQKNAIAYEKLDCGWKNDLSDYYPKHIKESYVFRGTLCPLLIPDSFAFQNFIDGVMPKLMQVYDLVIRQDVFFLILKPRDPIIYEMYKFLGISRERLVLYEDKPIRVETMINTCIAPPIHPALWQASREALGVSETLTVPWNQTRVVLLHRVRTSNGGRKILNVEEVKKYLFSRYGESSVTVFTGHLSFSESVDLFGKAKIIIGVHGGALYNTIYSPRETAVIEIMPTLKSGITQPATLGHEIFWFQSQLLRQTYWRLPVIPIDHQSDLYLPIDRLGVILQRVDKIRADSSDSSQ